MEETIIPAFRSAHREGMIVGRILAGYSELEIELLACVMGVNGNNVDAAVRMLFSSRGEKLRIENARRAIETHYIGAGLQQKFERCIDDLDYCRIIRNQYAHCQWYHTPAEGLCFIDLENLAEQPDDIVALTPKRLPLDVTLLTEQEQFFKYVQKCLWHFAEQYALHTQPSKHAPLWSWPGATKRPALHN